MVSVSIKTIENTGDFKMPEYQLSVIIADSSNRVTRKTYISQDLTDFPAAITAAAALVTDLKAISEGECLSQTLSQRSVLSDSAEAGANVDEGATFVLRKADNYNASHKVPMPLAAIRNTDGTIDITAATVTDYFDNFMSAGDWTVSDGEVITSLLGGTLDK